MAVGEIKMVGVTDTNWDKPDEQQEYGIETRLIGSEDIFFDSDGTGDQLEFTDRTDTVRLISGLNSGKLPIEKTVRDKIGGEAKTVSDALLDLAEKSAGVQPGLTEDKTVEIESTLNYQERQQLINGLNKNLGGKTLTVQFPEALDLVLESSLKFSGFYNGILKIDLNGNTISANGNIGSLLQIENCEAQIEIQDGSLTHTSCAYGVEVKSCPQVYFSNVVFTSGGGSNQYGISMEVSDGECDEGCVFVNDKMILSTGIQAKYLIEQHDESLSAHSTLFARKANAIHTHTPDQVGADEYGAAASAVSTHNISGTAHSGILAPLNSPELTGMPTAPTAAIGSNNTQVATTAFVARAVQDSGIADQTVSAHNVSGTAHSGILAPLDSPALTGTPTAPTAATGTNSTQIATTAFVTNAIQNSGIADAAASAVSSHNSAGNAHAGILAPLNSPELTGMPTAPTATTGSNNTQIATTAFVNTSAANKIGEHNTAANAHSNIISTLAPLNSPGLTGTPTAPSAAAGTNSAQIATTAFVTTAIGNHNSLYDAHRNALPAGLIFPYAGAGSIPAGYLLCDGSEVSRVTYQALFNAIGTTYGAGDEDTTFNLPDFRGQFLRGYEYGVSAEIGTAQEEGLPNLGLNLNMGSPAGGTSTYAANALSFVSQSNISSMNASSVNSLFGNSDHVTPKNYAIQWIIKV